MHQPELAGGISRGHHNSRRHGAFLCRNQAGTLTDRADDLLQRLKSRHLETSYVREYYLPFRMAPDRMSQMAEQIRPRPETPVNRDFAPIAYYFDIALWSTQFNERYREAFASMARIKFRWILAGLTALLVSGMLVVVLFRRRQLRPVCVAACVGAMGFTLMALEVLLLLGFQAIYGYVYQQLALLVAAVMMGMALGSWLGLAKRLAGRDGVHSVTLRVLATDPGDGSPVSSVAVRVLSDLRAKQQPGRTRSWSATFFSH